jgi:hypothetical protein
MVSAERRRVAYVYRCTPCEFEAPPAVSRAAAQEHQDAHRREFAHWWRFLHLEGVEHEVVTGGPEDD